MLSCFDRLSRLGERAGSLARLSPLCLALAFSIGAAAATPHVAHAANVTLEFTVPGDDSVFGRATAYDIRYSLKPHFPAKFQYAPQMPNPPVPGDPGTTQRVTIENLDDNSPYYFAMRAVDERGNWSPVSNVLYLPSLTVGAPTAGGFRLDFSQPQPSPARGSTRFTLTMAHRGEATVQALDVAGRRVRTIQHGTLEPGPQTLEWNLRDDQGNPLRPGVYLVRANAEGREFNRRVVVVH